MEAIYVLEPGCYIRREGAALKVVKGAEVVDHIPAENLKRLMLIGYVSLSGAVLDFLIRNRVETVFVTPTGRFRARLALDEHGNVERRRTQYLQLSRPEFALKSAGIIVEGKMENMAQFLALRARQYGEEAIRTAAARLRGMRRLAEGAKDLDTLRGVEGAASQAYFGAFPHLIRNPEFTFKGRNRRPPLDPVNALLSFVYTLLTNEVLSAIKSWGLDPHLGALHEVSYGRPSLACDLVEEYRCFLGDRLVLGLVNRKAVEHKDFVYRTQVPDNFVDEEEMKAKRPVEMKPAVGRALIRAYEEMMKRKVHYPPEGGSVTYRQLIRLQVRRYERHLSYPDAPYAPFSWQR